MPLVPQKSGVHRAACFALCRALLRQAQQLPVAAKHRKTVEIHIAAIIKRNAKLQGYRGISTALRLGYETLGLLRSQTRWRTVTMRILDLGALRAAEQRSRTLAARSSDSEQHEKPIRPPRSYKPRVWPYPGGIKVLDRPFREVSGRRHVPKLVNANKVPILQFKKPQSPFLSRMIRDIIKTRQKRVNLKQNLKNQWYWAEREDDWDNVLRESLGVKQDRYEEPWSRQPRLSHDEIQYRHSAAADRQVRIGAKMHAIVEREKVMALEEKLRRHKLKKARRLARSQEEQLHVEDSVAKEGSPPVNETTAKVESVQTEGAGKEVKADAQAAGTERTGRQALSRASQKAGRPRQQLQMEDTVAKQETPLRHEISTKMKLKENLGRTGGDVNAVTWTDDEKAAIKAARKKRKEDQEAGKAIKRKQIGAEVKHSQGKGKKLAIIKKRPTRGRKSEFGSLRRVSRRKQIDL